MQADDARVERVDIVRVLQPGAEPDRDSGAGLVVRRAYRIGRFTNAAPSARLGATKAAPLVQQSYLNRPGAVHPSTLPVVPNAGIFENTSVMKSMNTMARFESSLLAT